MITGICWETIIATILFLLVFTKAEFNGEFLRKHNEYRELHGSPPLELNKSQLDDCITYAKLIAAENRLQHSTSSKYGENLCSTKEDPLTCASMWYNEIKEYNYDDPGYSINAANFTQLVWRSSTSVSFGKAKSRSGVHYVVARYFPPGNIQGQYATNVRRRNSGFRSLNLSKFTRLLIWLLSALLLQEFMQK